MLRPPMRRVCRQRVYARTPRCCREHHAARRPYDYVTYSAPAARGCYFTSGPEGDAAALRSCCDASFVHLPVGLNGM